MNLPVPAIIRRNFRLKALAVGIALVVWTAVVYANNPPDTRTFLVPVQFGAVGTRWTLDHPLDPVQLRISGTKGHLDAFNPAEVSAGVDVSRISHPGVQDVPLIVLNQDPNVNLDNPPATVRAAIDVVATRQVPVVPVIVKTPPPGFHPETPTVTPGSVLVSGARNLVDQVVAEVEIDLAGFETNYDRTTQVRLKDQAGTVVTSLGTNPSVVQVDVVINSTITSRTVPIIVQTQGEVAAGHILASLTPVPQTVVLTGPQTVLQTIQSLNVVANITGLYGSVTETGITVLTPVGVTAAPDRVDVRIGVLNAPPPPTPLPTPSPTPTPTPKPTPSPTP